MRSRKKRLRHLLTICRGVSKRAAIASLSRPSAAYSTILARITSLYGDVYLRAVDSSRARSAADNWMRYGHFLGMNVPPWPTRMPWRRDSCQIYTSSYLWTRVLSFPARTLQINSPPGADRTESDEVAQWRARCGDFADELD